MAIAITGDLDWSGNLILFLEALDGGPAADVAGYAFTSSGDVEYSCSVPEPVDPDDRLLGVYRCVAKTLGGVVAGVGYVTIGAATTAVRIRADQAAVLDSATLVRFVTEDTGQTTAAAGSVAKLSQGAGAGSGGATLAKQNEILEAIDTYASSALATVNGSSGTIVGFPTSLNVGDSYTDETNSAIHVFIRDANDDPITSVGDFEFTDSTFSPKLTITQSGTTSRVKATVTYVDPGAAESYLKIEIPPSESRRVSAGVATMQCILQWVDEGKVLAQKTLAKQAVTWNEMI